MKLHTTNTSVERIGAISHEAQFQIRTSQKAFQILSDLYSDKPLAIVRELGCNAADAMVMAGKGDQPFHVHLPNTLEPWLTIQDFGTGISHDNIYDIYTVYFASTKTNTNSQIGCLGLGSKSPFSYSDNFTVTSIHQGVKRIYNAFVKEDGNPAIALASTENTNESNGLSVQIPVKQTDFDQFVRAAAKSFRFFDVKPTISGANVDWGKDAPIYKAQDWMFFNRNTSNYNGECFAIMGGVSYPVDTYQISDYNDKRECLGYHQMMRNGLVMKFAMGELDFTPARDALKYTDETKAALTNKLQKITNELPTMLNDIVTQKPTLLQAIRAVIFFQEQFHFLRNQTNNTNQQIKWGNVDLSEPIKFFKTLAPNLKHIYKRSYHRKKYTVSNSPTFSEKCDWFVEDVRGAEKRIRMYLTSMSDREVMLFNMDDYMNLLRNGFVSDMFQKCSDLPKPTVARKVTRTGTVVQKDKEDITIYMIGESHKERWENKIIEPNDSVPKYYVVKQRDGWGMRLKLKGVKMIFNKNSLESVCGGFDIDTDEVCMVTEREEKKLAARGCKNLIEHFKTIQINFDAEELSLIQDYNSYSVDEVMRKKKFKDLLDSNVIKSAVLELHSLFKEYKSINGIAHFLEGWKEDEKKKFSFTPAQKIVFDSLLGRSYHAEDSEWLILAEAVG
jgi:hypothetical protein